MRDLYPNAVTEENKSSRMAGNGMEDAAHGRIGVALERRLNELPLETALRSKAGNIHRLTKVQELGPAQGLRRMFNLNGCP